MLSLLNLRSKPQEPLSLAEMLSIIENVFSDLLKDDCYADHKYKGKANEVIFISTTDFEIRLKRVKRNVMMKIHAFPNKLAQVNFDQTVVFRASNVTSEQVDLTLKRWKIDYIQAKTESKKSTSQKSLKKSGKQSKIDKQLSTLQIALKANTAANTPPVLPKLTGDVERYTEYLDNYLMEMDSYIEKQVDAVGARYDDVLAYYTNEQLLRLELEEAMNELDDDSHVDHLELDETSLNYLDHEERNN